MKKYLVFSADGAGTANNAAACQRWAKAMGLRYGQFDVRPTGQMSNYVQEYGVYTTEAGKAKVDRKRADCWD